MKKLFTLGTMLVALATAGPALAGHGQSTGNSVLTVQVGSGNVSPEVSANAPSNVDAPVCVTGQRRRLGRHEHGLGLRLDRAGRPVGRRVGRHRPGRLRRRLSGRGSVRAGERERPGLCRLRLLLSGRRPAGRSDVGNDERRGAEPARPAVEPRVGRHPPGRCRGRRSGNGRDGARGRQRSGLCAEHV
jgi:hypothetical protein